MIICPVLVLDPTLPVSDINYYHCLKIVDILKETEKDSKNLFGFYGSQRMKDWQEVVSALLCSCIATLEDEPNNVIKKNVVCLYVFSGM